MKETTRIRWRIGRPESRTCVLFRIASSTEAKRKVSRPALPVPSSFWWLCCFIHSEQKNVLLPELWFPNTPLLLCGALCDAIANCSAISGLLNSRYSSMALKENKTEQFCLAFSLYVAQLALTNPQKQRLLLCFEPQWQAVCGPLKGFWRLKRKIRRIVVLITAL